MSAKPIIFHTTHRIRFSELDPYNHMSTGNYATYFTDHRMEGLRKHLGWDLERLGKAPFMVWVRRIEVDFVRPARADQEVVITSFVREFVGTDAFIECTMADTEGTTLSRCLMIVAYVDKQTNRATDWPPEHMAPFFVAEKR